MNLKSFYCLDLALGACISSVSGAHRHGCASKHWRLKTCVAGAHLHECYLARFAALFFLDFRIAEKPNLFRRGRARLGPAALTLAGASTRGRHEPALAVLAAT